MAEICHVVGEFLQILASNFYLRFQNGGRSPDSTKLNQIDHSTLKKRKNHGIGILKHNNEINQYNEKSDAACLKPMRAGDGNLKISLPWPNLI